jgi:hypothetical protein
MQITGPGLCKTSVPLPIMPKKTEVRRAAPTHLRPHAYDTTQGGSGIPLTKKRPTPRYRASVVIQTLKRWHDTEPIAPMANLLPGGGVRIPRSAHTATSSTSVGSRRSRHLRPSQSPIALKDPGPLPSKMPKGTEACVRRRAPHEDATTRAPLGVRLAEKWPSWRIREGVAETTRRPASLCRGR